MFKLRSRKAFPIWKQKVMSAASARGFDQYFTKNLAVKTQDELDQQETDVINETDDNQRRVKKGELAKWKRERKRSLATAAMLTSSVRSKDLKTLAKCKLNPKLMFEAICKKYGTEEDEDLTDLLDDFKDCKLKSRKTDPEDWYAELEQINEQLEEIDSDFAKSEKEIAAHILASLPKGYKTVKKFIKMGDNYLDDLDKVKKQIAKHWKSTYRKKIKKDESSDDSSSSSSSSDESDAKKKKKKNKGDQYALNVNETKQDRRNQYGIIICGHCNKPGHGIATCWDIHGRPNNAYNGNRGGTMNGTPMGNQLGARPPRRCWNCGGTDHLAANCPNVNNVNNANHANNGKKDDEENDDHLNNLFVGTVWQQKNQKRSSRVRFVAGNYEVKYGNKNKECVVIRDNQQLEEKDEISWCKINKCSNTDSNSSIASSTSFDTSSWCKMCSDDESTQSSNTSARNKEAEDILKQILGLDKKGADCASLYDEPPISDYESTKSFCESNEKDGAIMADINDNNKRSIK